MKMNDFETTMCMLIKAGMDFTVEDVEGEHPCICIPSKSPLYSTGVTYSFNDDGSLYSVHSYEPVEDCGCGGCEDALAECMEEDDLTYVTPEDLFDFIKSVYALIEVERGGDEM